MANRKKPIVKAATFRTPEEMLIDWRRKFFATLKPFLKDASGGIGDWDTFTIVWPEGNKVFYIDPRATDVKSKNLRAQAARLALDGLKYIDAVRFCRDDSLAFAATVQIGVVFGDLRHLQDTLRTRSHGRPPVLNASEVKAVRSWYEQAFNETRQQASALSRVKRKSA